MRNISCFKTNGPLNNNNQCMEVLTVILSLHMLSFNIILTNNTMQEGLIYCKKRNKVLKKLANPSCRDLIHEAL